MNPDVKNTANNTDAAEWAFHTDTVSSWEAMLIACSKAEESIDLEEYIFINDNIGQKFISLFKEKALQGVKIRILCDTAGSLNLFYSSIPAELKKLGIKIIFFNPLAPVFFKNHYTWWYFRDHRKLLVVDNKVAFTGSICIWDESRNWRDTFLEIRTGGNSGVNIVNEMQNSFNYMWNRAQKIKTRKNKLESRVKNFAENWSKNRNGNLNGIFKLENGFNFAENIPRIGKRDLYYKTIRALRSAKEQIKITVPYFIPDHKIKRALILARKKGVEVSIVLPKYSDFKLVDIAARTYFHELLEVGIKIFLYEPAFIHSKTIIVDNSWATIGSMNLDNIALRYNFEANVISTNKSFIEEMKTQHAKDEGESIEITVDDWKNRPFTQKVMEFFVQFIRSFL